MMLRMGCLASHMEKGVLDDFGKIMIKEFGEMKITTGNEHIFLGMKIKINIDKAVTIDMKDQIYK